jgi:hypothetical protein
MTVENYTVRPDERGTLSQYQQTRLWLHCGVTTDDAVQSAILSLELKLC